MNLNLTQSYQISIDYHQTEQTLRVEDLTKQYPGLYYVVRPNKFLQSQQY
jgi:hypothetical protein